MKNKLTIADIAELLGKKKAKYEKLANSKDKFENNTAKIKLNSINGLMEQLFQHQEATKPQQTTPKMAGGGYTPLSSIERMYALLDRNPLMLDKMNMLGMPDTTNTTIKMDSRTTPLTDSLLKSGINGNITPDKSWAGKQLNNPNAVGGAIQGVGIVGDLINQLVSINKMEEPSKVALTPKVRLNKNMDTSNLKRQAIRGLRSSQMNANMSGNSNVSNAVNGDLLSRYFNQQGDINSAENNYRSQMENQEAQMNNMVSMQNSQILNDLYSAQNQFANNRIGARSNAWSTAMTKGQMMAKDYRDQAFDMNVRLPLMSKWANQQSQDFTWDGLGNYYKKPNGR